ncbi:MAG TPA: hypothetical protein VKA15_02920 [Isosphaeraceae bacterium]|nr:hypothetical protein [Isosphaeraceae bacterium]
MSVVRLSDWSWRIRLDNGFATKAIVVTRKRQWIYLWLDGHKAKGVYLSRADADALADVLAAAAGFDDPNEEDDDE